MLAEQHCVCTESGLKMYLVQGVLWECGGGGEGNFFVLFKKMVLEHSTSKWLPAPLKSIISYSFLGC